MDKIERLIAELDRPAPSSDLDERIGKLVMETEWGKPLKKSGMRLGALIILLAASLSGYHVATKTQTTTDSSVAVTAKRQPVDASVQVITSSKFTALVMSAPTSARIWGTDHLTTRVAER